MFKGIVTTYRYLVGVCAFPLIAFFHLNPGMNTFSAWHNKPFGTKQGQHSTSWFGRRAFIILVFLYLYLIGCLSITNHLTDGCTKEGLFVPDCLEVFYATLGNTYKEFTPNGILGLLQDISDYPQMTVYTCFMIFVITFPFLALAHLLSIDIKHSKGIRVDQASLGDSLLFFWMDDGTTDVKYSIWSYYEPLLFATLGAVFFVNTYTVIGVFFILGAFSLFVQGNGKRLSYRKELDMVDTGYSAGQIIKEKENRVKSKHKGFSETPKQSSSQGEDGANFL